MLDVELLRSQLERAKQIQNRIPDVDLEQVTELIQAYTELDQKHDKATRLLYYHQFSSQQDHNGGGVCPECGAKRPGHTKRKDYEIHMPECKWAHSIRHLW